MGVQCAAAFMTRRCSCRWTPRTRNIRPSRPQLSHQPQLLPPQQARRQRRRSLKPRRARRRAGAPRRRSFRPRRSWRPARTRSAAAPPPPVTQTPSGRAAPASFPYHQGTSQFKGVSWSERSRKWRAQLWFGAKVCACILILIYPEP